MFGRKREEPALIVREYTKTKDYEKDARAMLAKGYVVQNVATEQPKPASMLLGGIGMLAPTKLVVTYMRAGMVTNGTLQS